MCKLLYTIQHLPQPLRISPANRRLYPDLKMHEQCVSSIFFPEKTKQDKIKQIKNKTITITITKKTPTRYKQESSTWYSAWLAGEELVSPISRDYNAENKKYNAKNKTDSDCNFTSGHTQWWSAKILAEHNEEPSSLWPHWTFSLPSLAGTSAPETICMRQILIESLKHRAMICKNAIDQHFFLHQTREKCNSENGNNWSSNVKVFPCFVVSHSYSLSISNVFFFYLE